MQVGLELRLDLLDQALHRLRLGLGRDARAAVGLVRRIGRRALVVEAPMLGEVAVGIDAVAGGDLPVVVVVAQVLAPQALVVERVLVAVRVGRDDEPQLGALEHVADLLVVRAPAVDEVVQKPSVDLEADPLARVLVGRVEDRRPRAVALAAGRLGDLQREQLTPLVGPAEHLELDDLRVLGGDLVQLVADATRLVPRAPDVVAADRHGARLLGDGLPLLVARERDVDARRLELRDLTGGEDGVGLDAGRRAALPGELDALRALGDVRRTALQRVHLEPLAALRDAWAGQDHGQRDRGTDRRTHPRPHRSPLSALGFRPFLAETHSCNAARSWRLARWSWWDAEVRLRRGVPA